MICRYCKTELKWRFHWTWKNFALYCPKCQEIYEFKSISDFLKDYLR